jgi:hypothetical protein
MTTGKKQGGIEFQPRDCALLLELLDSRLMTLGHAAALFFEGRREAAKKRLQKIRRAGLIVQRPRRPQEPAIYSLGRTGYLRLREAGELGPAADPGWAKLQKRQRTHDLMLRHELAVMDVKAALVCAARKHPRLELVTLSVSPDRHGFRAVEAVADGGGLVRFRSIRAKPDGFIHVREHDIGTPSRQHFFFLEVDRGTEALGRLLQKGWHYSQFYRNGGFAARLGHAREDYKQFPFRVLMAFKTAERRNNAAESLLKAAKPIKSQVWLTTIAELIGDPLGAIWIRPADYKAAIKGTEFDMDGSKNLEEYVRRPHREVMVEARASKLKLFGIEP